MSDLSEKVCKVAIINITKLKETMFKEVKKYMTTLLHQIENSIKEIEILQKYQMEMIELKIIIIKMK